MPSSNHQGWADARLTTPENTCANWYKHTFSIHGTTGYSHHHCVPLHNRYITYYAAYV